MAASNPRLHWLAAAGSRCAALSGCGGSGPTVEIAILEPTDAGSFMQTAAEVRLDGRIAGAGYVGVRYADDRTMLGYVTYFDGQGRWMADFYRLSTGTNRLPVVADHDGTGRWTKSDQIDVIRTTD